MPQNTNDTLTSTLAEKIYNRNLELLEERRRTELLLYSVSEIVLAIDEAYKITIFNRAAEKYFHIGNGAALGSYAEDLIKLQTENGRPIPLNNYCFIGDPKKEKLESVILITETGNYYVNVNTAIIDRGEVGKRECVITIVDITKEMQLDKTKDEFISITSHELRTPITIIKSYLWMLQSGRAGELTDKQKGYLEKAVRGSDRMLNLINDMLNIAHIEQGKITIKLESINLKEFIDEFNEEFKIKTDEKGLWLKNELVSDACAVYADKNKLREVFLNFLGNSAKFTSAGGITIHIENTKDDYVKVQIKDTGQGIKSEDLKKLFSKFGRLDSSYTTVAGAGGTGLGLYITKNLIEKMGGKVGVESEGLGKGSTFWFTLPAANSDSKVCSIVN